MNNADADDDGGGNVFPSLRSNPNFGPSQDLPAHVYPGQPHKRRFISGNLFRQAPPGSICARHEAYIKRIYIYRNIRIHIPPRDFTLDQGLWLMGFPPRDFSSPVPVHFPSPFVCTHLKPLDRVKRHPADNAFYTSARIYIYTLL